MRPYLSIILPVHNEQERLLPGLLRLYSFLDHFMHSYEVIVVENGSTDDTLRLLQTYSKYLDNFRFISKLEAGKGLAVREGMLAATGQWRLMADIDWSMDPAWIKSLLPEPGGDQWDICITTRNGPGALRLGEPITRHISGLVFNQAVRSITGLPFSDTQCGYKCFSARAAEDLFSLAVCDGWAFDVEILYLAMLRMYTISQVAITWEYDGNSRVRLFSDAVRMLKDVLDIKRRLDYVTVEPLERFA